MAGSLGPPFEPPGESDPRRSLQLWAAPLIHHFPLRTPKPKGFRAVHFLPPSTALPSFQSILILITITLLPHHLRQSLFHHQNHLNSGSFVRIILHHSFGRSLRQFCSQSPESPTGGRALSILGNCHTELNTTTPRDFYLAPDLRHPLPWT